MGGGGQGWGAGTGLNARYPDLHLYGGGGFRRGRGLGGAGVKVGSLMMPPRDETAWRSDCPLLIPNRQFSP